MSIFKNHFKNMMVNIHRQDFFKILVLIIWTYCGYYTGGIYSPVMIMVPVFFISVMNAPLQKYFISLGAGAVIFLMIMTFFNQIPQSLLTNHVLNNDSYFIVTSFLLTGCLLYMTRYVTGQKKDINQKINDAVAQNHAQNMQSLMKISHEFRTPLNAIIGFSEVMTLEMLGKMPMQYQDYCQNIHHSGKHLLHIVSHILENTRIEQGQYTPKINSFSPTVMMGHVLSMTAGLASDKSVKISFYNHFPNHYVCNSDEQAVKQILINVIGNAIKYAHDGEEIDVTIRQDDVMVIYEVRDYGRGFSQNILDNFGKPFNTDSQYYQNQTQSVGLGLSICNGLTQSLGGFISAENAQYGTGAIVTLCLPNHKQSENIPKNYHYKNASK